MRPIWSAHPRCHRASARLLLLAVVAAVGFCASTRTARADDLGLISKLGEFQKAEGLISDYEVNDVNRRPNLALTQFWCIRGLVGAEESGLKEIELSTAIHLAFHQLELCDLALCLAVGPSQSDCGADGGLVFDDPGGE